jgi:signal transduction histidine kinase
VTRTDGPRRPIAGRTRLALFLVGALCTAVAAFVFYTLWSSQTLALRTSELERQVGVIASGVAVGDILPGSVEDTGQSRARLLKVEAGIIGARLAVTDATGSVLYSTAGSVAADSYPVARLVSSGSEFEARSGVIAVTGVGNVLVVGVPVSFTAPSVPSRFLVGVRPLSDMASGDSWVLVTVAAAVLVGLLVALGLGTWLARRVTSPLVRLTEGSRAVAAGEWGRQVTVEGDDEVAVLARAFNAMSARVADAYRAQQEFVGDVSHELRTPVTSIKGFAQAIEDGTVDEAGVRRAAGIIREEADRLTDLTATLLALADLDAGAVELAREPVDVGWLEDALKARFAARAERAGVALTLVHGRGAPLGDPERLLQAVSTLVDNGLRYATAQGRVRIASDGDAGFWRVAVEDDGPGIAAQDVERAFGRFTRLDSSRSSASGGSGLGLAICRRIVELMGGRVWAEGSADVGGARFVIELPLAGGAGRAARSGPRRDST